MHDIFFPLINGFFAVLKSFENIPSILEMLGNLRVIRKSLMKNWESSEVFGLVNSWAVWPLITIFGVLGVFLAVSRVFGGIMGCSRGVPGLFRGVPGCSGLFRGVFRGCSGVFRGCSGVFRVLQTPQSHVSWFNLIRLDWRRVSKAVSDWIRTTGGKNGALI